MRPQNERTIYGQRGERLQDPFAPLVGHGSEGMPEGVPFGIPPNPAGGREGWTRNAEQLASATVYFDYDSSALKAAERAKVAAVADYLKANAAEAVEVQGHCDERGTEEYNRSLGERRALALREELVRLGVEASRVDSISYGEDRPVDPGSNEAAWGRNRRGEFIVLTPPQ
jgi:peptidoglycan-associated lipoprotein